MELLTHLISETLFPGVYLALGNIEEDHPEEILSPGELDRCTTFSNEQRKNEFISTRYLLQELSTHAGMNGNRLHVRKDSLGKPYGIYGEKRLYMSLAHTDNKVLCGLSEHMEIGIDMEPESRKVGSRLKSRILNPEEAGKLEHLELIRIWTIKEAVVKLLGSGLRTNLSELIIHQEGKTGFLARFNNEKTARICSFQYKSYWISIANFV